MENGIDTDVPEENPPPIPQRFVIFKWLTASLRGHTRHFCDPVQKDYDNSVSVWDNMRLFESF